MSQTSLLPPNASLAEKSLDLTAAKQLNQIALERISNQWDPYLCPENLLGWLAWALSVDDWNPDWPESIKRDVINSSLEVHRYKGTIASIKRILGAFSVQTELKEWQQDSANQVPYSFQVQALANSALETDQATILDDTFYQSLSRQIAANKPARSQFSLSVGARLVNRLGIGLANSNTAIKRQTTSLANAPIIRQTALAPSAASHSIQLLSLTMEAL